MRRPPIRIRTFILGTILVLLAAPTVAGGAAWLIERDHQQASTRHRLNTAFGYLNSHRAEMQERAAVEGFTSLLGRLDLLGQLVIIGPSAKHQLYVSPSLVQTQTRQAAKKAAAAKEPALAPSGTSTGSMGDARRLIPVGAKSQAQLVVDLYYRPASRATRALVALTSGTIVLLGGLAVAVWLAGRWMVTPLARLSTQVDKVAGGDLTIAVPRSRIGEIANIAQAVEGMTGALGETEQRRAEAEEARRFLVTSVAHDLRTPLFALRGHLQAIGSHLGDPGMHLERAEARADALERLIGNLFAYTRDDYGQPAPQLETARVSDLVREVTTALEHTARLRENTFDLQGDEALVATVDRDRLKRALTNVLDNALRYSPPGASIEVSWVATGASTVQVTVRDHGAGIGQSVLPHIFEPGIREAAAADSEDTGAGLGLTITKRLLEHQHATIAVRNHPAGGAEVSLALRRRPF